METIIENLTPGEFFNGIPTEQSLHPIVGIKMNSIVIGIIIGGVIVYIFKDDIEAFLNKLANKSSDKF